jgi:histidinol phosphatase-like PHP family hydrolase
MAFKLSERSLRKLEGVEKDLVNVVLEAIKITKVDFGVTYGLRTKHLEGRAVDLVAYFGSNISWELNVYDDICDGMAEAARKNGVAIKWGAAWSEGDIREYPGTAEDAMNAYIDLRRSQGRRPFIDAPHFEMM